MEKSLKKGYVILVMWLIMKYTFYAECNNYDAMRKKMFDNIVVTDTVRGIDYENTFIKLMSNSDRNITKAIANFVHDCGIT